MLDTYHFFITVDVCTCIFCIFLLLMIYSRENLHIRKARLFSLLVLFMLAASFSELFVIAAPETSPLTFSAAFSRLLRLTCPSVFLLYLLELAGDYKYLGAKIGVICVLHTWGSDLHYHPHIHCIVMGGGLNENNQWVDKDGHFFFPVKVMSRLFRGKFMDELKKLHDDDLLMYYGNAQKYRNQYEFQELVNQLYKTEWVSYIKEAFNGAQSVIKYLGKYSLYLEWNLSAVFLCMCCHLVLYASDTTGCFPHAQRMKR